MLKPRIIFVLAFVLFAATLSGCIGGSSQPSAYYVFSPSQEKTVGTSRVDFQGLGVGPVKVPEFLNRPEIVTRSENNVLTINDFHRWGDSLETQIVSLVVENMSDLLNTPDVIAYPWERHFEPAWQLYIDFRRFDGVTGGNVKVDGVWRLVQTEDNATLLTHIFSFEEPTGQAGFKAYVVALNIALEKLSRQIADQTVKVLQ